MQQYILTEDEVKNRAALTQAAQKYLTMNSYELTQALVSLGTTIALRGYKTEQDDVEAAAIRIILMDAIFVEEEAGRVTIQRNAEEPVKVYRLKDKLEIPDGTYSMIPLSYSEIKTEEEQ